MGAPMTIFDAFSLSTHACTYRNAQDAYISKDTQKYKNTYFLVAKRDKLSSPETFLSWSWKKEIDNSAPH